MNTCRSLVQWCSPGGPRIQWFPCPANLGHNGLSLQMLRGYDVVSFAPLAQVPDVLAFCTNFSLLG